MLRTALLSVIALFGIQLKAQTTDTLLTTKLADNVYLFEATTQCEDIVDGNTMAVIGTSGILLVDDMQRFRLTEEMLTKLRKISPLPVKYVVNTHWHGDHTFGNNIIRQRFPSCVIIAHQNMRSELDSVMKPIVDDLKSGYQSTFEFLDTVIKHGQYSNGRVLSSYELTRMKQTRADCEIMVRDMQSFEYSRLLPDICFTDSMTIDLGNEKVILKAFPKAHSATDVMVWLPSKKILATGDIVVSPAPYAIESEHENWKKDLAAVIAMKPSVIVPGHGSAQYDLSYVNQLLGLINETDKKVRAAWKKGITLKELMNAVDISATQKKFTGGDPEKDYAFRQFFFASFTSTIMAELEKK